MARIRTIKPEFWVSAQVAECSTNARLLFVGLWNFADDQGVHPASPRQAKMEVFPGDPFTVDEVQAWIDELLQVGLLGEFTVPTIADDQAQAYAGQHFWFVTGWHHQRIDKPSNKYPDPRKFAECSTNVLRTFQDQSCCKGRESIGRESIGVEGKGKDSCSEPASTPASEPPFLIFPIVGSDTHEWALEHSKVVEYANTYPGIDAATECRKARQWCADNPSKRKTAGGMMRFLNSWMSKAQNDAGRNGKPKPKYGKIVPIEILNATYNPIDGGAAARGEDFQ